jgi:hypothetical protein
VACRGRGLARLRGRHNDAVAALCRAELIVPHYVQRDPITRDVIAELLARARQDAVGRELGRSQFIRPLVPVPRSRPAQSVLQADLPGCCSCRWYVVHRRS